MKAEEIERMFPWGPAKRVKTRYGPRLLRKAVPSSEGMREFLNQESALKRFGVRCEQYGLFYQLFWWQKVKEEVPPELIAKTEVREIGNNDLTKTCKEVEEKGGRITALDHLKAGYKLTISWPQEKGQA